MKKAFEKLEQYNYYVWIAIFIDIIAFVLYGFMKKYTGIITTLSRADVYEAIEKYIGEHFLFELISRYIGVGLSMILIAYILILLFYIFIVFGIPNIMCCITKAIIKHHTSVITNIIVWLLCFASFIPGVWSTTNMITMFIALTNINIVLLHIVGLVAIQCVMIILYIIEAVKSFNYKEEIANG